MQVPVFKKVSRETRSNYERMKTGKSLSRSIACFAGSPLLLSWSFQVQRDHDVVADQVVSLSGINDPEIFSIE